MEVEDYDKEDSEEEYEEAKEEYEEAEVDYREELLSVKEFIIREKKKNKKLQSKLDKKDSITRTNDHKFEGSNRRR